MSNDFETITRFLNRYGDDVEGRELDEIPAQLKPKFRDFAMGTLKESDRKELAMMLKEHPHWVTFLAEEARAARGGGQPNP